MFTCSLSQFMKAFVRSKQMNPEYPGDLFTVYRQVFFFYFYIRDNPYFCFIIFHLVSEQYESSRHTEKKKNSKT